MSSYDGLPKAVAVELPLNVRNEKNAIDAIGGTRAVANVSINPDQPLELRLRKEPFHHPITSTKAETNNIILQVTLPKWALDKSGGDIHKAIQLAGRGNYTAKPAYFADANLRFREMADFQYYMGDSPFAVKMENSVYAGNLDQISRLSLDHSQVPDLQNPDIFPPPRFSQQTQPFFYNYKQNPSVTVVNDDSGRPKLVNKASSAKIVSAILSWDDEVPVSPPAALDPSPREIVQSCIVELQKIFEKRPCYTRRALEALISPALVRYLKYALPYVSYFYRSGPWRGAYIRYGFNPTHDRSFAKYQVEHFRGDHANETEQSSKPRYEFDGVTFPTTRMLQLCDIYDNYLNQFIKTDALRATVDGSDGWFELETMAVIRRVLRAELANSRAGKRPLDQDELERIRKDAILSANKATKSSEAPGEPSQNDDADVDADIEDDEDENEEDEEEEGEEN